MKKYILFVMLMFSIGIMQVGAANNLMQCDYVLEYGEPMVYFKYRIIYKDDNTISQSAPQLGDEDYSEIKGKILNPTLFKSSDDSVHGQLQMVGTSFSNTTMKNYYEKGICPILVYKRDNPNIFPAEDLSLNDGIEYVAVEGVTTLFNENEEPIEQEKPEITTVCSPPSAGKINNVPSMNIQFFMYDNGEKYFKFYFTEKGESFAQIAKVVDNQDTVINAKDDMAKLYTITLPSAEIQNVFFQTNEQKSNNTFTCVDEIYMYEETGIQDGYYKITTDYDEAKQYSNATDFGTRGDTEIDWPFDANSCNSILGYIDDTNAPAYYLDFAFNIIKYAAIVILLVFTIIEYAKAVASSKDDAIKKATQNTIKRVIIAVIIFFLPYLIIFILNLLGIVSTNPTCGIGV